MISFKSFLTESRSAPLYHGTLEENLRRILKVGSILPNTTTEHKINNQIVFLGGISLTRNREYALRWAADRSDEWYNEGETKFSGFCVIHIDQLKLTHNFNVKPYNYNYLNAIDGISSGRRSFNDPDIYMGGEYEEFVKSKKGLPLKLVTKIELWECNPVTIAMIKKYPHITIVNH